MTLNIPEVPQRRTLMAWIAGVLTLLVAAAVVAVTPMRADAATFVDLGEAESYAVLAGSTVTNTGPSVVTGDVGVSPGTAITGFPPGTVVDGTIHAGAAAAGAQAALGTAYDDAFGQPTEFNLSAAPVTPTLIPGTYAVESGLLVNGTWTLDAGGNPDAVWVFKVPAGLTTASGSNIVLQNGAQACNVFWVTDESATLGSDSNFVGTLMALTSITVNSGATVEGRVLARNGAVTLDNNVITRPECDTTTTTTGDAATGDAATGDAATGDAATGDAATGDAATGDAATGDAATGDAATGDAATGDAATGDAATGDAATGDAATGDAATGDAATGDAATGDAATGDAATGDAATGDAATGDAATGDAATGDAATGGHDCDCHKPGKPGHGGKPGKPGHGGKPGKPAHDKESGGYGLPNVPEVPFQY
ncbi:ice-binding family protein [Streptomyces cahuitamycinicus]|uniref:ice-binding family protein n=1 Tax=Streptomyces cahuitamycinicus TaxID=2070367 RepID=UPI001C63E355|nr:ice-binding family protein [Streptomyces cahuitamycinicus]